MMDEQKAMMDKQIADAEANEAREIASNPALAKKTSEPFAGGNCKEGDQKCLMLGCAATDIPQVECEALVELYFSTIGAKWTNTLAGNKKRLANNSACSRYGVSC